MGLCCCLASTVEPYHVTCAIRCSQPFGHSPRLFSLPTLGSLIDRFMGEPPHKRARFARALRGSATGADGNRLAEVVELQLNTPTPSPTSPTSPPLLSAAAPTTPPLALAPRTPTAFADRPPPTSATSSTTQPPLATTTLPTSTLQNLRQVVPRTPTRPPWRSSSSAPPPSGPPQLGELPIGAVVSPRTPPLEDLMPSLRFGSLTPPGTPPPSPVQDTLPHMDSTASGTLHFL